MAPKPEFFRPMRCPAQAISVCGDGELSIPFRLARFGWTAPVLLERGEPINGASRRNVFSSEQSRFNLTGRPPRDTLEILGGDASDASASNGQSSFQADDAPGGQIATGAFGHHPASSQYRDMRIPARSPATTPQSTSLTRGVIMRGGRWPQRLSVAKGIGSESRSPNRYLGDDRGHGRADGCRARSLRPCRDLPFRRPAHLLRECRRVIAIEIRDRNLGRACRISRQSGPREPCF